MVRVADDLGGRAAGYIFPARWDWIGLISHGDFRDLLLALGISHCRISEEDEQEMEKKRVDDRSLPEV
jgi:hypothetical protein